MSVDVFGKQQGDTDLETEEALADIQRRLGLAKSLEVIAVGLLILHDDGTAHALSPASVQLQHNLGYVPAFLAFLEYSDGSKYPLPYTIFNAGTTPAGTCSFQMYANSDASNLTVLLRTFVTNPVADYKIRYYLFREPAQ